MSLRDELNERMSLLREKSKLDRENKKLFEKERRDEKLDLMREKSSLDRTNKSLLEEEKRITTRERLDHGQFLKNKERERSVENELQIIDREHDLRPEKLEQNYIHEARMQNIDLQRHLAEGNVEHIQQLEQTKSTALWSASEKILPKTKHVVRGYQSQYQEKI